MKFGRRRRRTSPTKPTAVEDEAKRKGAGVRVSKFLLLFLLLLLVPTRRSSFKYCAIRGANNSGKDDPRLHTHTQVLQSILELLMNTAIA
ncbi:unnamed protein product [Caenorhabditis auriculariae]|uniref:Uncharacterized protein n=1 Tax=Caenorhabditis auriculariae TaxID=2777116 RepID=A0A8S1HJS8_9PELO|nr:unnamed protein product [Caenorhabditis auriculariae]